MNIPALKIQRQLLEIRARLVLRKKTISHATDSERKADLEILVTVEEQYEGHLERQLDLANLNPVLELVRRSAQGDRNAFERLHDLHPSGYLQIAQKASASPDWDAQQDRLIANFSSEWLIGLERQRDTLEQRIREWSHGAYEEFRREIEDRLNVQSPKPETCAEVAGTIPIEKIPEIGPGSLPRGGRAESPIKRHRWEIIRKVYSRVPDLEGEKFWEVVDSEGGQAELQWRADGCPGKLREAYRSGARWQQRLNKDKSEATVQLRSKGKNS